MILVASLLGILFFRFLFGIVRNLLLVLLVCWVLFDESRINPQFGKMFWESVSAAAERVAEFGREQQNTGRRFNDESYAAPRTLANPAYDRAGTGYR